MSAPLAPACLWCGAAPIDSLSAVKTARCSGRKVIVQQAVGGTVGDIGNRHQVDQSAPIGLANLTLSFQDFLDTIPAGAVFVDARGVMTGMNVELGRQFGYDTAELLGQRVEILVPAGLRDDHVALRSKVSDVDDMRQMGPGRSLLGQRKDGSVFPIEVGLRSIRSGGSHFVLAVVSDRSDHVRALESEARQTALGQEVAHQEMVAREMGHRVKNLMATVAALISLSARGSELPKEMEQSLQGRIMALSSVIDLAFKAAHTTSKRGALTVDDILRAVLAPFMSTDFDRDRVSLSGPEIVVGQRSSEVLALVFHELMTNALKYGALRHLDGRLTVGWERVEDHLELRWQEVAPQFRPEETALRGFGTKLMSRLIEGELGGRIDRELSAQGWMTCLNIPVSSLDH